MDNAPVIVEKIFNVPVDRLWKTLTEKEQMRKWYFNVSDFRPKPGFEFYFEGRNGEKVFKHICTVTEAAAYKKLAYTWRYEGFPGDSLVIFELFPGGNSTRLRLIHAGIETFPNNTDDFLRENFVHGWNEIIGKNLPDFLKG